jgi:hypothetical protein
MLSVIVLSVIMLGVIMLGVIMLGVIMLGVIMLVVIMLGVIMLGAIMLGAIMLIVIMLWFWTHFVVLLKSDLDVQRTHLWMLKDDRKFILRSLFEYHLRSERVLELFSEEQLKYLWPEQ